MPHDRSIRQVLYTIALLAAALSVAACDVVVNSMHGGQVKAEQAWTRSYTLTGADARIDIVNTNGTITVEATDGATVEVKASITAHGATEDAAKEALAKVEIREDAGVSSVRLEARYPKTFGRQGVTVNYTLKVPKSVKVDVATVNGGIHLTGVQASIKAETTNGSIELKLPEAAKATVSARCVNGGIAVNDLAFEKVGEGTKRKLDGKINGGGAPVSLETVNGSIRVGRAS